MDGQRFDDLARRLGSGTTRRGVLKGIAAGLGAGVFGLGLRRPQNASADPREFCETDADCGANELCRHENLCCSVAGGICAVPFDCCTGWLCNTTSGLCETPPDGCIPENDPCNGITPCCGNLPCTYGVCGTPTCGLDGDPCDNDNPCCMVSGLQCYEGSCTSGPEGVCGGHLDPCEDDSTCCAGHSCEQGHCELIPACGSHEAGCQDDDDCCDGLFCSDASTCEYVSTCAGIDGACEGDADCCAGLVCAEGSCDVPKGTCGVPGDSCEMTEDHLCCNGLTCFEGLCDNPSGLCMEKGGYCDGASYLCCDGLYCGDDYFCHKKRHGGHHPNPPAPKPQAPVVTTLPNTGGNPDHDGSGWLNAAALGGAAALLGGALLRKKASEAESETAD